MGNEWPFTRHIQSIVTTPVTIPGDTMTVALIGIKLLAPITDVNKILAVCEESDRIESAQAFINNAAKELEQGALVFFAGDLNEPSYLDWQADTKDLFDHRGCIVNWGNFQIVGSTGI